MVIKWLRVVARNSLGLLAAERKTSYYLRLWLAVGYLLRVFHPQMFVGESADFAELGQSRQRCCVLYADYMGRSVAMVGPPTIPRMVVIVKMIIIDKLWSDQFHHWKAGSWALSYWMMPISMIQYDQNNINEHHPEQWLHDGSWSSINSESMVENGWWLIHGCHQPTSSSGQQCHASSPGVFFHPSGARGLGGFEGLGGRLGFTVPRGAVTGAVDRWAFEELDSPWWNGKEEINSQTLETISNHNQPLLNH